MSTPTNRGVCPVCNGTLRRDAGTGNYRHLHGGYRAFDNSVPCDNCGGQYMFGTPTGNVPLDHSGAPCTHAYRMFKSDNKRCLHDFRCDHCGDTFQVDSGD